MTVEEVITMLGIYKKAYRVVVVLNEQERLLTGEIDIAYAAGEEDGVVVLRGHVIDAKE